MHKIFVIDDDPDICSLLKRFLSRYGFEVLETHSGKKALNILETFVPDLVMTDFRLEDMDGKALLVKIKEKYPRIPVIIITGYSDIKTAVEVMKLGAYDYVTKPLFPDEILVTIRKALEGDHATAVHAAVPAGPSSQPAVEDNNALRKDRKPNLPANPDEPIFSDSVAFQYILKQINLVAPTNYSIIIYGESGSGKEVIANEIHKRSKRKDKPFVAIDCGALSRELAGSELFGHEKGSFTGAVGQKIGSFELANGGTIFLDEIANLSYDIQV